MIEMTRPEAEGFQTAWNGHDMTALGSLFHEDATFVNRFRHMVRGVDEIIALHAPNARRCDAMRRSSVVSEEFGTFRRSLKDFGCSLVRAGYVTH